MLDYWPWFVICAGLLALLVQSGIFTTFLHRLTAAPSDLVRGTADKRSPKERHGAGTGASLEKSRGPVVPAPDLMPMLISVVVLAAAIYVILSRDTYADAQQKWAFGAIGTILGYWLKR